MTMQMSTNLCRLLQIDWKSSYYTYFTHIQMCDFAPMYNDINYNFRYDRLPRKRKDQGPIQYGNCLSKGKIQSMDEQALLDYVKKLRDYFDEKYFKIDYDKFSILDLKEY